MQVHGFLHKVKAQCDYCHRIVPQILKVTTGPCTGKFCSRNHYQLAREAMEKKEIPNHEKIN